MRAAAVTRTVSGVEWRRAVVGVTVVLAVLAVVGVRSGETLDEHVYRQTVVEMRGGAGYYEATVDALGAVYGPPSQVRALRPPTLFVAWRWVPGSETGIRLAFVVFAALSGLLAWLLTRRWWTGPAVFVWMVAAAGLLPGMVAQEHLAELWVVPFVLGAWWAWRSDRDWLAVGPVIVACACREFGVLLLIGGVLAAAVERRSVRPWIAGWFAVGLLAAAHVHEAALVLTAGGRESPLIGYGYGLAERIGRMAGFGLPARLVVGPVMFAAALWGLWRRRDLLVAPLALLPLTAVIADRPYWGALVVPVYLVAVGGLGRVHEHEVHGVAQLPEVLADLADDRAGSGDDDRRVDEHEVGAVARVSHDRSPRRGRDDP
jgi:hypothetical protein